MQPDRPQAIDALLVPRSIAIVGASPTPGKPSGMMMEFLARSGYRGAVYPVNPKYDVIQRWPCFPSLDAIKGPPDLAVVITPADGTLPVLEECAATGVGAALVMSGGFGEGATGAQGAARRQKLEAILRGGRLRLLGPNTIGIVNFGLGLPITFADWYGRDLGLRDKVAVLTQSGSVGGLVFSMLQNLGIGINYWVGLGNEVDLETADFIDYFAGIDDVNTVICFLEGLKDGCRFIEAAARLRAAGKTILVLKAGRSSAAQRSTLSHTGKMSTSGQRYSAVFAELGIIETTSLREVASVMQLLRLVPRSSIAPAATVGILSASGGICSILADHATDGGLELPELSQPVQRQLARSIPEYGSTQNPVDLSANAVNRKDIIEGALKTLRDNEEVANWVVFGRPVLDRYHALIAAEAEHFRGRLIACSGVPVPTETARPLADAGIPLVEDPEACMRAIGCIARRQTLTAVARPADRQALQRGLGRRIVAGLQVYEALCRHGVPMPRSRFLTGPHDLAALAREAPIRFPVAVKSAVPEIPHKTESGCVELGIGTMQELSAAIGRIAANIGRAAPGAESAIEIQEMVEPGRELILTFTQDADFGPMAVVGFGGTAAELLVDSRAFLLPAPAVRFLAELKRLKGWPLLSGFRRHPPADLQALVDLWTALSRFYEEEGWVGEIELNPVIVGSTGAAVVDSLVTIAA